LESLLPTISQGEQNPDDIQTPTVHFAHWREQFSKILPVLHEPTIHPENCSPLLLTAITAIGASYFSTMRSQRYYVEAVGALCDVVSAVSNSPTRPLSPIR
jgi:hypothetical protein